MSLAITPIPAPPRAEPDPDAGCGALSTDRGNLPLHRLDVTTHITGLTARTQVVQAFRNPHAEAIEATYIFPLPDRAAVTAMSMTADGRTVRAELRERAEARDTYDRAVAAGKRASIAESERADVFTMRVGNVLPGEEVTVRLELSGPLAYEDGEATLRVPLVVAPRYIPGDPLPGEQAGDGTAADTDAVPDASRITPPVLLPGFPNPVDLSLETVIDPAGLPLRAAASSLHTVVTEEREDGTTVVRLRPGERLDRDFILRLAYGDEEAVGPSLACEPDDDGEGGTFRLTLLPPAAAGGGRPRDVVVLLDRSGSMGGWKIVAARRAAARIVDTLGGDDRFAVRVFDHGVDRPETLGTGLTAATDRHRYRAVEFLGRTDARGGTVLMEPLRQAAALLGDSDGGGERDRVLVLVTDGQVGNEDQILAELSAGLRGVRVHVVGIDRAVNAGFLNRLALVGRGRCELVESEDRLDEATARIHRRIAAPVVTDLELSPIGWETEPGTLAPARLPDLFAGAPVVLSGRYRGRAGEGRVLVSGRTREGDPWSAEVPAVRAAGDGSLRTAWARAHLRELEDRYATGAGDLTELEGRITATSLANSVLCRFTAFVAVDHRVVTEGGTPHRVIQPVEPPDGWELPRPPAVPGMQAAPASFALGRGAPAGYGPAGGPAAVDGTAPPPPAAPAAPAAPGGPPPTFGAAPPAFGPPPPAPIVRGAGPRSRRGMRPPGRVPVHGGGGAGIAGPVFPGGDPDAAAARAEAAVRGQLADELAALRAAPADAVPEHERRERLSDLLSRLRPLLATVEGNARYRPLRELAEALAACDGPQPPRGGALDLLWHRTVTTLAQLSVPATPDTPGVPGSPAGPGTAEIPPPPGSGGPRSAGTPEVPPVAPEESGTPDVPEPPGAQGPSRRAFWKRKP